MADYYKQMMFYMYSAMSCEEEKKEMQAVAKKHNFSDYSSIMTDCMNLAFPNRRERLVTIHPETLKRCARSLHDF